MRKSNTPSQQQIAVTRLAWHSRCVNCLGCEQLCWPVSHEKICISCWSHLNGKRSVNLVLISVLSRDADNTRCLPTALATRLPLTSGLQKMSTNIRLQWQGCLQDGWVYQYCSVFLLLTLSGTIVTSHLVARARFVAEIHPERGFPCSCRQKKKSLLAVLPCSLEMVRRQRWVKWRELMGWNVRTAQSIFHQTTVLRALERSRPDTILNAVSSMMINMWYV